MSARITTSHHLARLQSQQSVSMTVDQSHNALSIVSLTMYLCESEIFHLGKGKIFCCRTITRVYRYTLRPAMHGDGQGMAFGALAHPFLNR
jgi:hypothetical protein